MTLDEQITAWALAQNEACKLALLEQRAAVMPLRPDEILSDNPYAPRRETIIRVAHRLSERLDRVP